MFLFVWREGKMCVGLFVKLCHFFQWRVQKVSRKVSMFWKREIVSTETGVRFGYMYSNKRCSIANRVQSCTYKCINVCLLEDVQFLFDICLCIWVWKLYWGDWLKRVCVISSAQGLHERTHTWYISQIVVFLPNMRLIDCLSKATDLLISNYCFAFRL